MDNKTSKTQRNIGIIERSLSQPIYVGFFFCLIAILIFGYATTFNFVLDDENQVVFNSQIHSFTNFFEVFKGSTLFGGGTPIGGLYYKPIMSVFYIILWAIFHENAFGFHCFQLLLHICNSYLVFLLFRDFFDKDKLNSLSFFLGLIFLVHPANVETVVYVADLQDTLYMVFGLLTLNFFSRSHQPNLTKTFILTSGFLLSILSKETGILYFIIVLIFARLFRPKLFLMGLSSAGIALCIYLFLRFRVATFNPLTQNWTQMHNADFKVRLLTLPSVLCHYLILFFFPKNISLTEDWAIRSPSILYFWVPLCAVVGLLCLALWLWIRWKNKTFLFFFLWLGFGLGAHSQIVALDGTVADRWFYFPMVGLLGIIGVIWRNLTIPKWIWMRKFNRIFLLFLFLSMSARSLDRTLDWKNGMTLSLAELAINPNNFYMNNQMGIELQRLNKFKDAIPYFEKSIQVMPCMVNLGNLADTYQVLGQNDLAEIYYKKSFEAGLYYTTVEHYINLLISEKRYKDLKAFVQLVLPKFPANEYLNTVNRSLSNDNSE